MNPYKSYMDGIPDAPMLEQKTMLRLENARLNDGGMPRTLPARRRAARFAGIAAAVVIILISGSLGLRLLSPGQSPGDMRALPGARQKGSISKEQAMQAAEKTNRNQHLVYRNVARGAKYLEGAAPGDNPSWFVLVELHANDLASPFVVEIDALTGEYAGHGEFLGLKYLAGGQHTETTGAETSGELVIRINGENAGIDVEDFEKNFSREEYRPYFTVTHTPAPDAAKEPDLPEEPMPDAPEESDLPEKPTPNAPEEEGEQSPDTPAPNGPISQEQALANAIKIRNFLDRSPSSAYYQLDDFHTLPFQTMYLTDIAAAIDHTIANPGFAVTPPLEIMDVIKGPLWAVVFRDDIFQGGKIVNTHYTGVVLDALTGEYLGDIGAISFADHEYGVELDTAEMNYVLYWFAWEVEERTKATDESGNVTGDLGEMKRIEDVNRYLFRDSLLGCQ